MHVDVGRAAGRGVSAASAVPVHLDRVRLGELVLDDEFLELLALVALQLDHLPHLLVVDDGAVAVHALLARLEHLLHVDLGVEALDRRDALAPVALLDADVDQVGVLFVNLVFSIDYTIANRP